MAVVDLADLSHEERVALLALLQRVVAVDGRVSEEEREELAELVDAFGEDGYQKAVDDASNRFADDDQLKAFLQNVGRPEARELIMGLVLEAAIPEATLGHESDIVNWLSKTWGIETQFEDADEAEAADA